MRNILFFNPFSNMAVMKQSVLNIKGSEYFPNALYIVNYYPYGPWSRVVHYIGNRVFHSKRCTNEKATPYKKWSQIMTGSGPLLAWSQIYL
jgi:hypothetical protein